MKKTIIKACDSCNNPFLAKRTEHKRGNAKFCSRKCFAKHLSKTMKQNPKPNVKCALCGEKFYMNTSKQKNSKSGLFFCCRSHKDMAQRIGGIKAIQPNHYNDGSHAYREIAFRHYDHKCNICQYNKIPEILVVHHIDRNRNNNNIENLQILCPNCHEETHFQTTSGKWTQRESNPSQNHCK